MTTIAVAIVGRAITVWEAIQKWSHEPIYKTSKKIEAKGLIAINKWGAIEKRSNIAIAILDKLRIWTYPISPFNYIFIFQIAVTYISVIKMTGGLVWAIKNGDIEQVKELVDKQVQ